MSSTKAIGLRWPEFNNGLFYNDVVKLADSELTLIEFYCGKYKNSAPQQGWLQRIRNGQITVDGRVVIDPDSVLRAGAEMSYHRLPWKEPDAPYLMEVLYEDDDMIALNKPSGLQVLPAGLFQQRTVLTQLQWWAKKQISIPGKQQSHPVPVHRLGRGTSGILLCAKTKHAKSRLSSYFAEGTSLVNSNSDSNMDIRAGRKICKRYRALVTGIIDEDELFIKQPIGVIKYPGVAKGLYVASPSGKPAVSKVSVLERDEQGKHTFVEVEIQSGRPHQIRIHLSYLGHPLFGDPLYVVGGQPNCSSPEYINESFAEDGGFQRPVNPVPGDCGYYLHAHQLVLFHPNTNEELAITAPLPPMLITQKEGRTTSTEKSN